VGTEDAHLPECIHTLADDFLQLGPHLVLIGTDSHAVAFPGNEEDAAGERCRVNGTHPALAFSIHRPCLSHDEPGLTQGIYKRGPSESGLVGVYDSELSTRLEDAIRLLKRLSHHRLVSSSGLASVAPMTNRISNNFLLLRRPFGREVFRVEVSDRSL